MLSAGSKWYTTGVYGDCNIPEASCTRASFKGFFKNDMIQAESEYSQRSAVSEEQRSEVEVRLNSTVGYAGMHRRLDRMS